MKPPSRSQPAFTLIELLILIVILGLLSTTLVPAITSGRESADRARCVGNLRQIGVALHLYAEENDDKLPRKGGNWPFDLSSMTSFQLLQTGAVTKENFYCPAKPEEAENWNFATEVTNGNQITGYHIVGYVLLLDDSPAIPDVYQNERLGTPPPVMLSGGRDPTFAIIPESQRVLAVDTVLGLPEYHFIVDGGGPSPHRTNHMSGNVPAGGNVLYLDGNVEWRPFAEMQKRTFYPTFWW